MAQTTPILPRSKPFATVFAALRERAGLSRGAFALVLDVHPATVSRYENGKRVPDAAVLTAIADALVAHVPLTHDDILLQLVKSAASSQLAA